MRRAFSRAALAVLALGCSGTEPSEDQSRCFQTHEFGNSGCADVAGLVTDESGSAVVGAYVSIVGPLETDLVYGPVQTSSTGEYKVRAIRMSSQVTTAGPDTVTVWVRAALPPPIGSPDAPSLTDSVQATLQIQPVGSVPVVVQVATLVIRAPVNRAS